MKISDILNREQVSLSFEVFPPKSSTGMESILTAVREIADLRPSFMSVTYGAAGSGAGYTLEVARELESKGVPALAHLTCVGADRVSIREKLTALRAAGVENILALRGDLPKDTAPLSADFSHASDLVEEIVRFGGFDIGGACYPESHPEAPSCRADIEALKLKVEAGCRFLTTQMFFDNNIYYNFVYRLREAGVNVPVVAGIMPVTSASSIKHLLEISGNSLPQRFVRVVDRFGDNPAAMMQAGIAYATDQIIDLLANGVKAVHVYSMNKPAVAAAIMQNLSEILK